MIEQVNGFITPMKEWDAVGKNDGKITGTENGTKSVFQSVLEDTIPSLTVCKRKNRCNPCIYWAVAIFLIVTKYGNLFFSFTFFLDRFHSAFRYKLIIRLKAAGFMKIISNSFPFV